MSINEKEKYNFIDIYYRIYLFILFLFFFFYRSTDLLTYV